MPHYDEARGLLSAAAKQNATLVADATHAATSKASPVDLDEIPLIDSASSFSLKKLTWGNLKTAVSTYLSNVSFAIGATTPAAAAFTSMTATLPSRFDDTLTVLVGLNAGYVQANSVGGFHAHDGAPGTTTTVTTADLVGKTMVFRDGILVGFS